MPVCVCACQIPHFFFWEHHTCDSISRPCLDTYMYRCYTYTDTRCMHTFLYVDSQKIISTKNSLKICTDIYIYIHVCIYMSEHMSVKKLNHEKNSKFQKPWEHHKWLLNSRALPGPEFCCLSHILPVSRLFLF